MIKFNESRIAIAICFLVVFQSIEGIFRKDAYQIFDKFTYPELFQIFKTQILRKSCKASDGPSCYFNSPKEISKNELVIEAVKMLQKYGITISVENVYTKLKSKLDVFREKFAITKSEVFKVAPKIAMNLLMTFESYDTQVLTKDMYMPEEKVINFNVGFLKLSFLGLLKITIDRKNPPKFGDKSEGPALAYGVVEKSDLSIKVDKVFVLKHFYIRPNPEAHKDSQTKAVLLTISGYKSGIKVFEQKKVANKDSREWIKVIPSQFPIDTVVFPKGSEVDDILFSHQSEATDEQDSNNPQVTKMLHNIIEELIEQTNKKEKNHDDDL